MSRVGTWIPLADGKELAVKNGVFEKLRPMFEYVPGDRSPPPAPKHATAASSKPRVPRAPAVPRRQPVHQPYDYAEMDAVMRDDETPDNITVASESAYDDYEHSQYNNSRKRRRVEDPMSQADKDHRLWADDLLDYFLLQENPLDAMPNAPEPPMGVNINRPIDDKGHTALHWASAMGDMEVVKDLVRKGASIEAQSQNGETPLMRSVIFTNCFDRQNMERLSALLIRTVNMQEFHGSTVFHNIAGTTQRKSKYSCARYYMDCLLNRMSEVLSPDAVEQVLNTQDQNGDTAITIAARHGARKCVRSLLGRNAAVDIPNLAGETADQLIVQLNARRQERASNRQLSSSPFQGDPNHPGGSLQASTNGVMFDPLAPHSSMNGGASFAHGDGSDVYKSETALALTSQIMPTLFTKAKTLASSIDAEIAEKDAELAEAERVLAMRKAELDSLKKAADDLRTKEQEQTVGGAETDDMLEEEVEDLQKECFRLEEQERAYELSELHQQEKARQLESPEDVYMAEGPDAQVQLQFQLARDLIEQKRQRLVLIKQLVANLSVAGFGDKQDQYKRLITGALGVKEEDVEGLLPDIVTELEESHNMEAVGA